MTIKLDRKFAERDLGRFIDRIYLNYLSFPHDKYYFDFTDVEFIGNQELLEFSALLKSFIVSGTDFRCVDNS